jgi:predicted nucleotidyltransferase
MNFEPNTGNRNIAIFCLTGSHNYNLNTPSSDKDWKIFVNPTFDDLYSGNFYSTSEMSEKVDYTVHDIRKLAELIWKANINFIEVMFSREFSIRPSLNFLFDEREKYASMNLPTFRNATYGMHLQKMGKLHKGTETTTELIEKFGYDTKEATHALRCLYVLEKYGETENMEKALWFNPGKRRDTLLKVKDGGYTEAEFMRIVEHWHTHVWGELSKSYNDTTPNLETKKELDDKIKSYVKAELKHYK